MAVIIGERYRDILEAPLLENNLFALWMPDNPSVDARLAGHADLSALVIGDKKIILSKHLLEENNIVSYLFNECCKIIPATDEQGAVYPRDATLCACLVGNRLIHSRKCGDSAIFSSFSGEYINVNQGYSKCSVCVVGDGIITSDAAIAKAAGLSGIDVLQIAPGNIVLDGFDYGFIGGASFACGKTIFFTGTLDKLPENEKIVSFITKRGYDIKYLTKKPIFDIGGAVEV